MSDTPPLFDFSQFVPGFDFLKNLTSAGAKTGASAGLPGMSSWVAPTLSVEEVDKRIQELRTVQYWLEQNGHALKATIQALEVQKMTLSTLQGMNVRMEDLANAFTRAATPPAAAAPPRAEPPAAEPPAAAPSPEASPAGGESSAAGVVDPMQWWGALTQQFQQIATTALQEAAHLKMPAMGQPTAGAKTSSAPAPARKPAPRKPAAGKPAGKTVSKAAGKASASRRRPAGDRPA